jgi:hypothetical protein
MHVNSIVAVCVLLGGCAAGGSDCGSDSYALGQRDAMLGVNMADHAARCGAQGNPARYAEGWREGFSRRPAPSW